MSLHRTLTRLGDFLSADFRVKTPVYQRQYSWEVRQLEDLWNDLVYLELGKRYYFGTILLKKIPEEWGHVRVYEIIDGQQRLASVLILLKAISDAAGSNWDGVEGNYPKFGMKLELLGGDEKILRGLLDGSESSDPRSPSERRLITAMRFFREKLHQEQRKIESEANYLRFLNELMDKALNLEIMEHIVDSDEEAVLIFETVNDRGISLSVLDKTKSFLMRYLYLSGGSENDLKQLNGTFASIFSDLDSINERRVRGAVKSPKEFESDVQRVHYIIFKAGSTYFSDVFSSLKEEFLAAYRSKDLRAASSSYALKYASSLGRAFSAICEMFLSQNDELSEKLDRVFGLNYTVIFPLVVSGWIKLRESDAFRSKFLKLLKSLECLEFRYSSFRSRRSYTLSERINSRAYDLYNGRQDLNSILSSIHYLTKRYGSDGAFRADLESENFYFGSKAAMRLLFYEYETRLRSLAGMQMEIPLAAWMSDNHQIDHIWARAALSEGSEYQEYLRCGNKLGNLAVAPRQLNIALANANFSRKKVAYSESGLLSLSELAEHSHWRERQINERGAKITDFALRRWAIPDSHAVISVKAR